MQVDYKAKENSSKDKEFYNHSILKHNAITDLCYDITSTEGFDVNVEKVFSF
jgi:hypothetical protein